MLVNIIENKIPEELYSSVLLEYKSIIWEQQQDSVRRSNSVFEDCIAVHPRIIDRPAEVPPGIYPDFILCKDNLRWKNEFENIHILSKWVLDRVDGTELGRIQIARLNPYGKIKIHIDYGKYYECYSRFHVPLETNTKILFFNEYNEYFHMPVKSLCRLNNISQHGVVNNSDEYRIHLIVDVKLNQPNSNF